MKILHVAESLAGGPASYLQEIIPYQIEKYGAENIILLIPLEHKNHIKIDAIETIYFNRTGRNLKSTANLMHQILLASRKMARNDVIHLHSSLAGLVGRFLKIIKLINQKIIYCAHCWFFDKPETKIHHAVYAHIEKFLYKYSDAIINISPHEEYLMKKHKFKSDKIITIKTGISAAKIEKPELSEKIRLIFIGRLDEQKGVDFLIRSWALLDKKKYSLTIVGSSIVGKQNFDIPTDVTWHKWLDRNNVIKLLNSSDLLIMPSRWEGLPIVALEAIRSGVPIIGNKIAPLEEIIYSKYKSGICINFSDSAALKNSLATITREEINMMSNNAIQLYRSEYTSDMMNEKICATYAAVISNKKLSSIHY